MVTGDAIKFKVVFPFNLSKEERAWYVSEIRIFAIRLKALLKHAKKMHMHPANFDVDLFEPEEIN